MVALKRICFCIIVICAVAFCAQTALVLNNDFTLANFENLKYVGIQAIPNGDPADTYNLTEPSGYINNGPTTDRFTAPQYDSSIPYPTNVDNTPPGYVNVTGNPGKPGGATSGWGNWDQIYNTGIGDWGYNSTAVFSNSTTVGVTKGSTAIAMNPNYFGQGIGGGDYTQHLSLSVTLIGAVPKGNTQLTRDTTASDADYANIQSHKYLAVDVTFQSSDWTHGTFANTGAAGTTSAPGAASVIAYMNAGTVGGAGVYSDRTGFDNLGQYVPNPANTAQAINRPADADSRQALLGGTPGVYDPGNHTGTYTTTMYWDYSHWQAPPGTNPGDPASGVYYDLRQFFNDTTKTSGSSGYLEFMFATGYDNGYTAGKYYFDNMRVTNEVLRLGDFNNDGHINAADIVACEHALTNLSAYQANPTGLPSGDALSAQDMLTIGDIDGDGKFNNADLQAFITDLKSGLGSTSTVPEPASWVLLGLALPGLSLLSRRKGCRS